MTYTKHNSFGSGAVRLNKYLATSGVCSRRKADLYIEEGRISVNGKVVTDLGVKIDPMKDEVYFNEKQVVILDEPVYIVMNKPRDTITTSRDERGRTTVMDYVKIKQRVYPVGRLDRKTTGVLILTNDGDFANRLMHPRNEVRKAYKVLLKKALAPSDGEKLAAGVRLSDGKTKPAEVLTIPGGKGMLIGVVIHEGKNRQVHRMFEALGYEVEKLDRVAYAEITYDGLPRGKWRHLTRPELRRLKKLAGMEPESQS